MTRISLSNNKGVSIAYDDSSGFWYLIDLKSEVFNVSTEKNLTPMLQVLEESPSDLISAIRNSTKSEKAVENFPINELLEFCLKHKLSHWLRVGSNWLEYFQLKKSLRNLIFELKDDKSYPQDVRHSLLKFI